ncbi:MAG: DUF3502 domain-containing protein [Oscillospiraceae bacterium]|jgi:putative aldouronate transport system substrate-binding protein|nr:DUF3502 domain-containing protein [Oscillospiraceae bacterium]
MWYCQHWKKKIIAGFLAGALTVSCFAGCSNPSSASSSSAADAAANSSEVDTSKAVTLKMYLVGDKGADFDEVYDKVNQKLKKKINATLQVKFLSWAEAPTKYSLLFSSGEDFDLIFTASGWEHYEETVARKGFYELTPQFIKKYAPDIMKIEPEEAWKQAKVNGKIYMVPNYNKEYGAEMLTVRGDLMKKYGFSNISSQEQLESFFDKVAADKKATGISPLGTQGQALEYSYLLEANGWTVLKGTVEPLFAYKYTDSSDKKVISVAESQEFRQYAKKMKEMQQKGYWSKDALSTKDTRSDNFVAGKAAAMEWNLGSCFNYAQQVNKEHPSWKATIVDFLPNVKKPMSPYINNGIAINARSHNPERAMMAINQLMTNKTIYDLTAYGIEGMHYKAVGTKEYIPLAKASRYPAGGSCCWGWHNDSLKRTIHPDSTNEELLNKQNSFLDLWNKDPAIHPLSTFSFNKESVKTQDAILTTLVTQYMDPISTGLVNDPDKAVSEFISKLKTAGIDKVKTEIQNQINQFQK